MEWRPATTEFNKLLEGLPTENSFPGGTLAAFLTPDYGWMVGVVPENEISGPGVRLSNGRENGSSDLAFQAVPALMYALYDVDPREPLPRRIRSGQLVAATWYYPDSNWYIDEPVVDGDGNIGFPTTKWVYGQILHHGMSMADSVMVICEAWGPRDWMPRKRKK